MNPISELFIAFGQLAIALIPFALGGLIVFILVRSFIQNRRLVKRLQTELPEIGNPADRMEAIMKGIQKATRG